MEETSSVPKTQAGMKCIIHCSSDDSNLVSPQNLEPWQTLLKAAQIRQHAQILDLAEGLDCLTMSELAKARYSLKMELQHARAIKAGDAVKKVALQLRIEI
ncbi:unnamed protein product [Pleuronectes platessa]|uniref:Uncharacterized protein n=1 Tax=Pleuronectes platessa TaxID=8262 RepID=A0A9N7UVJ7_PLEPL|nr:unnamed protein product [Pleuronectes platessa]